MGLLTFIKNAGEKLFGRGEAHAAAPAAASAPKDPGAPNKAAADAILAYIKTQNLPTIGLTVTASAPRRSNKATAWRAAVEPISPRFASTTTGTSPGIVARSRSSAASPSAPNASKNARFGFTAAAWGSAASRIKWQNDSRPPTSRST